MADQDSALRKSNMEKAEGDRETVEANFTKDPGDRKPRVERARAEDPHDSRPASGHPVMPDDEPALKTNI